MSQTISTCDLCDAHEAEFAGSNAKQLRLLPDVYKSYGGMQSFFGQAHTLRCPEDNSRVREAVAQPGEGRVLVVDGGGMTRRALGWRQSCLDGGEKRLGRHLGAWRSA